VFDESPGAVIIPSHVFSELMNVMGKKLGQQVAVAIGKNHRDPVVSDLAGVVAWNGRSSEPTTAATGPKKPR
jgi:hypothetical protein